MRYIVTCWQVAVLLVGSLTSFNVAADDRLASAAARQRELVHSPMRSTGERVSLEWAIDASDVIVEAKLDARRQPQEAKIHKRSKDCEFSWPVCDPQRMSAICDLYQPGDQVLFFVWHDTKEKTWQIFDYVPLIPEEIRKERLRALRASLPPEDQSGDRVRHFQKEQEAGVGWLAMDKNGQWISDEAAIVSRVAQRVSTGSHIPPNADRQAVLHKKSVFGGFYVYVPQEPAISSDEFPTVLVPPDSEYRSGYLKSVRSQPSHQGKLEALTRIVNYQDTEVIEALKSLLTDNLVNEVSYKLPERRQQGNTYYILNPDAPHLKQEPNQEKVRIYILRRAAWDALKQMEVFVEPPEFTAK